MFRSIRPSSDDTYNYTIGHLTIQQIRYFLFTLLLFFACSAIFYNFSLIGSFTIFYFKCWSLKFPVLKLFFELYRVYDVEMYDSSILNSIYNIKIYVCSGVISFS
jgi:hypothetical protein